MFLGVLNADVDRGKQGEGQLCKQRGVKREEIQQVERVFFYFRDSEIFQ